MLCHDTDLELAGTAVAGAIWHTNDEDSVYAVFELENCPCGVTYELGAKSPFLRFTPGIQLPKSACAGFERFQFDSDDEDMVDLELDHRDGEITFQRHPAGLSAEAVEREVAGALAWVDKVAYPEVIAYLAEHYRSSASGD